MFEISKIIQNFDQKQISRHVLVCTLNCHLNFNSTHCATVPLSTTLSDSGEVLNAVTAILSDSIADPNLAPRFSAVFEGSVMDISDFISNTTIDYIDSCDGKFEEIIVHMPTGKQISIKDPERMEMFGNSVEMPKTECTTVGGPDPNKPCVFPFKHNGTTFITCALSPNDERPHWCSTLVDEAGEFCIIFFH